MGLFSGDIETFQLNMNNTFAETLGGLDNSLRQFQYQIPGFSSEVKEELSGYGQQFEALSFMLKHGLIDMGTAQTKFDEIVGNLRKSEIYGLLESTTAEFPGLINTIEQILIPGFEQAASEFSSVSSTFSNELDLSMQDVITAYQKGLILPSQINKIVKEFELSKEDIEKALDAGLINSENIDVFTKAIDEKMKELTDTMLDEKYEWDDATIESMENQKGQWQDLKDTVLAGAATLDEGVTENLDTQTSLWGDVKDGLTEGANNLKTEATNTKKTLLEVMEGFFGIDNPFIKVMKIAQATLGKFGFKIPGCAEGGVVTKPTLAMVGESGPEAIVPLSGSGRGLIGDINISFNGPISSALDVRQIANEVVSIIKRELSSSLAI